MMHWWKRPRPLAILLSLALASFGLFIVFYDLVGLPWPGMAFGYRFVSLSFGILWLASAVLLWFGPALMITMSVFSVITMFSHGFIVILGGTSWGAVFLFSGLALLALTGLANEATREARPDERDRSLPRAA